jgi:outer membrane receptor for ferrienterochelin and colicins
LDPRPGFSPTFNILNLQATKKVSNFEFFIGVKNLFDFKPPLNSIARAFDPFDKEVLFDNSGNAVVTENNPFGLTFDPTYVFYSNQGRRSFFGLRYLINN